MTSVANTWTRSRRSESRYGRISVLLFVRYGVVSISNQKREIEKTQSIKESQGKKWSDVSIEESGKSRDHVDRSKQIYARSMLMCRIGTCIRRTKLEANITNTVRRSGKRVINYATESVKMIRLRTTMGCRMASANRSSTAGRIEAYEYPVLMRLATRGLIRLVNANDRIGIYIAIEWLSLCLYVIAAFRRGSAYSTEAGLKYYVVGAFGSAWMLLGITLIYGWRGSLNRMDIERRRMGSSGWLENTPRLPLVRVGWIFLMGAFLLKLAGVPLHRWLADVYEGAPRTSVLYFAVVPKIALFRVRVRRVSVWYVQVDTTVENGSEIISVETVTNRRIGMSVRSMAVGAIGALTQRRIKRFRAYSTIGHTGYILLGVRRGTVEGVQGVRIYSIIYRVISRVMWQIRIVVKVYKTYDTGNTTEIRVRDRKYRTDRYQLGKENPVFALRVARTCMSMAGVPPLAGFGAKRSVFRALITSSYYRLGAVAVIRSVISAFNYLRVIKRMFFEDNVVRSKEEIAVVVNKEVSRRRGREGRFRTALRFHPSSLLLRTHRIALELVGM